MKDGSIEILYANGNTSINKRNGLWVSTNNKGLRWSKSTLDGAKTTWDPCPYAPLVDPESGSKVIVRSDNVIIVIFADESRYTKHADGTEIWTNKERTEFIIEHESMFVFGFCEVF